MRHQRGYIFESNGAFHVRYNARELVNGETVIKQRSHRLCAVDRNTGHGTKSAKAVRELCETFMRTEVNTEVKQPQCMTVAEFWEKSYLPFITANHKNSTLVTYKDRWENQLKGHFGKIMLKDYKTPMHTVYLTHLAKTYRPRTLMHIKRLASAIFSHAVATGECDTNPIRDAKVLGKMKENTQTQAYTLEEIENVITALVDRVDCQLIMALAFYLGLRKGEIAGLQWGDVDADYIHIRRACVRGVVGTPKTLKSVRSVPLIAPVKLLLILWRSKAGSGQWVFSTATGNPKDIGVVAKTTIRAKVRKAGHVWKGLHAGRRGLGTTLRELTGNSNAGRDMLGHSDTATTQAHYEAAMPEEVLKGMKLLEEKVQAGH